PELKHVVGARLQDYGAWPLVRVHQQAGCDGAVSETPYCQTGRVNVGTGGEQVECIARSDDRLRSDEAARAGGASVAGDTDARDLHPHRRELAGLIDTLAGG